MQNRTFCNLECLHCFCSLSKGIFNALKRYYIWPWNTLTVINVRSCIVRQKQWWNFLSARQNPYVKFILKGQGIFSLDVDKILRLQVTLNSRYAKNVIRYSFFRTNLLKGRRVQPRSQGGKMRDPGNEVEESHVSQTNRIFLKRGLQPHRGSCFT